MPVQTRIQIRRDTAANWSSTNPILDSGEFGYATDTKILKVGNGVTAWNSLPIEAQAGATKAISPLNDSGAYLSGSGLVLSGLTAQSASTPDAAALDITGDIDLRAKVAMTDWTPAAEQFIVAKFDSGANQRSYALNVFTDGTLVLRYSDNGTNSFFRQSTVATGATDGATKWVRATLDVDNGASGNSIIFYLSDDGTTWTQLGTTVTNAGTTSVHSGSAILTCGARADGTQNLAGTLYRAQVRNGIGGTVAFDANFETATADALAFTESSANAATVTINTTRYLLGIPSQQPIGVTTLAVSADTDYFIPFFVSCPIAIDMQSFEVTTGPASTATFRSVIYRSDNNFQPSGAPVVDFGAVSIATSATGVFRTQITPIILQPGYYLSAINASAGITFRRVQGGSTDISPSISASPITVLRSASRTHAAFPSSSAGWNTKTLSSNPVYYFVFYRWKLV